MSCVQEKKLCLISNLMPPFANSIKIFFLNLTWIFPCTNDANFFLKGGCMTPLSSSAVNNPFLKTSINTCL